MTDEEFAEAQRYGTVQDSEIVRAAVDYAQVYAERFGRREKWVPFSQRERFGRMSNAEVDAALLTAQRRVYDGALRSATAARIVEAARVWRQSGDALNVAIAAFNARDVDVKEFDHDAAKAYLDAQDELSRAVRAHDAADAARAD